MGILKLGCVVVGAGTGVRLGEAIPKCLLRVDGVPLLLLSVWSLSRSDEVSSLVLVVPPGYETEVQMAVESARLSKVSAIVAGGTRRQDSVKTGLTALPDDIDRVLIHDGARPLVPLSLVNRLIEALYSEPAVTAAIPVNSTLHRYDAGYAAAGPDRSELWEAQTPQGFERQLLQRAFEKAERLNLTVSDEVTLVRETEKVASALIRGGAENVKITHPDELQFYQLQLRARVKQLRGKA